MKIKYTIMDQENALEDPHEQSTLRVIEALHEAKSILILTGSGMSEECGLPVYRKNTTDYDTIMRQVASAEGFRCDPQRAWRWYNARLEEAKAAKPGVGYLALLRIKKLLKNLTLATQNIDGLHQKFGYHNVLELHGNLQYAICSRCETRKTLNEPLPLDQIEHECGGIFYPNIVKFGDTLPASAFGQALSASMSADVILSIGTSQIVMPAAALLNPRGRNPFVVDINPHPDFGASYALTTLPYTAAVGLEKIANGLSELHMKEKTKYRFFKKIISSSA